MKMHVPRLNVNRVTVNDEQYIEVENHIDYVVYACDTLIVKLELIRIRDLKLFLLTNTVEFWCSSVDCFAFCFFNRFKLFL